MLPAMMLLDSRISAIMLLNIAEILGIILLKCINFVNDFFLNIIYRTIRCDIRIYCSLTMYVMQRNNFIILGLIIISLYFIYTFFFCPFYLFFVVFL